MKSRHGGLACFARRGRMWWLPTGTQCVSLAYCLTLCLCVWDGRRPFKSNFSHKRPRQGKKYIMKWKNRLAESMRVWCFNDVSKWFVNFRYRSRYSNVWPSAVSRVVFVIYLFFFSPVMYANFCFIGASCREYRRGRTFERLRSPDGLF